MNQNFRIITSNSAQKLMEHLAADLEHDLTGKLFAPAHIIVRNSGARAWLTDALSRHTGFLGNVQFMLPADLVRLYLGKEDEDASNQPHLMPLILMEMLSEPAFFAELFGAPPSFAPESPESFALASKVSGIFTKALDYNPDIFLKGELPHPKAEKIWRRLLQKKSFELAYEKLIRVRQDQSLPRDVPSRLFFFGFPFLNGLEFLVISELAAHTDINFYMPCPGRDFWSLSGKSSRNEARPADLLNNFGKAGRFFIKRLLANDLANQLREDYTTPEQTTLLHKMKTGLLQEEDSSPQELSGSQPTNSLSKDESFVGHSCMSAFREVEVAREAILRAISDNGLSPDEVLVLAPDINLYSAEIAAVFESAAPRLPYYISEQSEFAASETHKLLQILLGTPAVDLSKELISEIIGFGIINRQFGFSTEEADLLLRWLEHLEAFRSNLSGQRNGSEQEKHDYEGSWLQIRERLILGHVMQAVNDGLFMGISPDSDLGGLDGALLGKFLKLLDALLEVAGSFGEEALLARTKNRSLESWGDYLKRLKDAFMLPGWSPELESMIARIKSMGGKTGGLLLSRQVLAKILEQLAFEYKKFSGFSGQGVHFSSIVGSRGIPAKFIFVLGMNKDDFPKHNSFQDNIFNDAFHCEPDIRDNQLFMLLEVIMNAQERLHFSYQGYDAERQHEIPPSSTLMRLLKYARSFVFAKEQSTHPDWPLVRHTANSFDEECFAQNSLVGSSSERAYQIASMSATAEKARTDRFWNSGSNHIPLTQTDSISLGQLIKFFSHPVKHFCKQSLKIENHFPRKKSVFDLPPSQPSSKLERQIISKQLLLSSDASSSSKHRTVLAAQGCFPRGALGDYHFMAEKEAVESLRPIFEPLQNLPAHALSIEHRCDGILVHGTVRASESNLLASTTIDAISLNQAAEFWLSHVMACTAIPSFSSWKVAGAKKSNIEYLLLKLHPLPKDQASLILDSLLKCFMNGHEQPLPLFPYAARMLLQEILLAMMEGKDPDIQKTAGKLADNWQSEGFMGSYEEGRDDFYISRLYKNLYLLDTGFLEAFQMFFNPLLEHLDVLPAERSGEELAEFLAGGEKNGIGEKHET